MSWNGNIKSPRVGIVVISWNGLQDTLNCLTSLCRSTYRNWQAVLVDNASEDGTVEAVEQYFPNIHLIANKNNVGYANGNNQGIQWAQEMGADWILLLNNDVILDSHSLAELVQIGESSPDIGVVGPVMQRTLRPDIHDLGGDLDFKWGRVFLRDCATASQNTDCAEIDYVWGCTLMARCEVFDYTDGLKPFYVAYFEDAELCMRAKELGYRTVAALNAHVVHHVGRSGEKRFLWQTYLRMRNHALFFLRFAKVSQWITLIPSLFLVQLPMIFIRSARLYAARKIRREKYADRQITLWGYKPQIHQPSNQQIEQWLHEANYSPR